MDFSGLNKNAHKLNARTIHLSLFELNKIKQLIKKTPGKKIVFLFKVLDSLEMLERNYSKKFLEKIVPLADKVVVSFATKSIIKKKRFRANRNWLINFIKEKFNLVEDFELGNERYIIFNK